MGRDKNQRVSVFGQHKSKLSASESQADWCNVDAKLLVQLVCMVTSRGGAIRFGYTRDGGAYAVGLYYGGDHTTEYVRPSEDISARLLDFIGIYEDLPNSAGKSPDQG